MEFNYRILSYINSGNYAIESNTTEMVYKSQVRRAVLRCTVPDYEWCRVFITEFGGEVITSTNF